MITETTTHFKLDEIHPGVYLELYDDKRQTVLKDLIRQGLSPNTHEDALCLLEKAIKNDDQDFFDFLINTALI